MTMYRWSAAPMLVLALVLGACAATDDNGAMPETSTTAGGGTETTSPRDEENVDEPLPPIPSVPAAASYPGDAYPAELSVLVEAAVSDLADRLTVETGTIDVVVVEEVVWPDRSLGCPQPGMMYAQVLTDGLRIVLVHDGVEFAYHGDGLEAPFLCVPLELEDPGRADPEGTVPTEQLGGPGGEPDV